MSEPVVGDLGAALARTVSALEGVDLEALEPKDRALVERAQEESQAALAEYRRAMRMDEPFPQED